MNSGTSKRNLHGSSSGLGLKRKAEDISDDESSISNSEDEIESQSDNESNDWDHNCKVVDIPLRGDILYGFHLMPTCIPKPTSLVKKFIKINDSLKSETFMNNFKGQWKKESSFSNDLFEIITEPWKICVIKKLLSDETVLNNIRQEFYELDWNKRQMDLYNFHQSLDLKYIDHEYIKSVYNILKNEVMPWIGEIMEVELNNISATCSLYADTDFLLVHDDQQEDRVIAFVLYLSDVYKWEDFWGGALQLLDRDENNQPNKPIKDIFPKHNQLVLFPVSSISYHQVAEVTSKNFCRLSINGWFHGKGMTTKITPKYSSPLEGLYSTHSFTSVPSNIDMCAWINEEFLQQDHMSQIQKHIEEYSEISLSNFFHETTFSGVLQALGGMGNKWKSVGPPNRYKYETLVEENLQKPLSEFIELFKSEQMFSVLQRYTELDLTVKGASMRYELQRWTPGCYSLLSDYEWNKQQELDVILYLGCNKVVGGQIQYVSQDEEVNQALITLEPKDNTLNLVFRDTARIICHVSKYTKSPFYILICSFTECN